MRFTLLILIALALSNCGPLLGLKEIDYHETKLKFITGFDVQAGINGIDHVNNNRGIKPYESK